MTKKIILIAIILIILIFVAGTVFWVYQPKESTENFSETKTVSLDPKNCAYSIENQEIVLSNGYSEKEIVPGSASKVITRYFGNEASGDFNGDGLSDTAFVITQNLGGSGTFYYAVVSLASDNGCRGTNAVFLGDRIAPQTTEFRDGEIIVNYADRKPGESMTEIPSVGVSKYFKIIGGELSEFEK